MVLCPDPHPSFRLASVTGLSLGLIALGREQALKAEALERALAAEEEAKANSTQAKETFELARNAVAAEVGRERGSETRDVSIRHGIFPPRRPHSIYTPTKLRCNANNCRSTYCRMPPCW